MGLIKALTQSVGSTFADQWKEYFYCESIDSDILVTKGQKKRGNNRGSDNIISNGSIITVADGQCMIIVDQGKVAEICAEPGEFTYDASSEPTIFSGSLGTSIVDSFKVMGKRFTYGGEIPKDQRVYYFNTKEIIGNKYGTATPIPFRVVDTNIGLDIDIAIRCNGEYSYKVTNPLLFYTNVCGNITESYSRTEIDSMLKAELMNKLQPAFAKISAQGVRYSALPGYTTEISDALNEELSIKWRDLRGIQVASFSVNSVSASKEDEDMIKEVQKAAVLRNPAMMAATLAQAKAQAMQDAANNEGGAMMAFAGMNMAQMAGGGSMSAQDLMAMTNAGAPQQAQPQQAGWKCSCGATNQGKFCMNCGKPKVEENSWICSCGASNTGKFCMNCGGKQPDNSSWACECGSTNTSKFCMNCGKPKPGKLRCNKCGYEPDPSEGPVKFCKECGDIFNEEDK